ncbi:MAG TPA: hypothetical protein VGR71_12860 [Nitrospira sp.]|nr:hypothetical protein [Nitrospira sp.]
MPGPYRMHVGVVTHAAWYQDAPLPAVDYSHSVDEGQLYPLILYSGSLREQVGTCRVRQEPGGGFAVTDFEHQGLPLDFSWDAGDESSAFYGSFTADESGRATLDEVVLVVRQH